MQAVSFTARASPVQKQTFKVMAFLDFREAALSFTGRAAPGTVTQYRREPAAFNRARQNAIVPSALLGMKQVLGTWLSRYSLLHKPEDLREILRTQV